mgnify:CR=1 FL=1
MKNEKIQNKIDDLIYKANHTSDYKRWQKINAQIDELKKKGVEKSWIIWK